MGLFSKKLSKGSFRVPDVPFDPAMQKPVLRCSICTGEQVAGFKNLATGKITEVTLIRNEEELKAFLKHYGLEEIEKVY